MRKIIPFFLVILGFGLGSIAFRDTAGQATARPAAPVGSAFTYQGRLAMDGTPATGNYHFRFRLFDAVTGGNQVGNTFTADNVSVADGLFSVQLDFGAGAFDGEARWLEVAVREGDTDGAYTPLADRQRLTPTPYALHATEAGSVAWTDVQNRPPGLDDGDDTSETAGSPYANVLVVAQSGGAFSSVQAALDSIGDAGAANPYLVYVGPGVYSERVTLKPYVTVEGAGEGRTIVRGTGGSQAPGDGSDSATLIGANDAAVRHLTVESDGTGQNFAVAIYNSASTAMSDVTASASGGNYNFGVYNTSSAPSMGHVTATASGGLRDYGVFNIGASPAMNDVTASASNGSSANYGVYNASFSNAAMSNVDATASGGSGDNYGVRNSSSAPRMTDVTAMATGGDVNTGVQNWSSSSPAMTNVTATAVGSGSENIGVHNDNSSPTMTNVIAGGLGGGSANNYGVYNDASLPTMSNVTATAEGASNTVNYSVYNTSSSPEMTNVTAGATGGTFSYGVYNAGSSPTMSAVTASASGGSDENYGVYNSSSSPTMSNLIAAADGGSTVNYGVYNTDSSPAMTNVTATASGAFSNIAVRNNSSSPRMSNVTARGSGGDESYGVYNTYSSPTIQHSTLEGSTASVNRIGTGSVKVANSQLIGPVVGPGLTCFDNYNASLTAVTCS